MNYDIAQLALYLVAAGLLALGLGWWLARWSSRKTTDRVVSNWQERLQSSDTALGEATDEVRRLADQIPALRAEVEESRDKEVSLAAKLDDSERRLAGERETAGELRSRIEERDSKNAELTSEISRWREEAGTLQQEQAVAQEDIRRLEEDLERERDHGTELEAAQGRLSRRVDDLEGALSARERDLEGAKERFGRRIDELESALSARGREDEERRGRLAALDEEVVRLRKVKLEFQEWIEGAARREEELDYARQQLEAVGHERDALATEVTSLRGDLDEARSEAETRDAAATASRDESERLSDSLTRARDRIRELEADEALASRLAVEIEGLHSELAGTEERERELARRAQAAEEARTQIAEELQTLLTAPLVDVDSMATARSRAADEDPGEALAAAPGSGPELLEAPRGAADDLKKIRGIGTVLESLLNSLGVYHFRQIASWSPSDIAWVASHVNTFPDRIERDGWTVQAAELHHDEHGEEE